MQNQFLGGVSLKKTLIFLPSPVHTQCIFLPDHVMVILVPNWSRSFWTLSMLRTQPNKTFFLQAAKSKCSCCPTSENFISESNRAIGTPAPSGYHSNFFFMQYRQKFCKIEGWRPRPRVLEILDPPLIYLVIGISFNENKCTDLISEHY